ncbi:MAG: family 16 glycosylhydrolase [Anaerolineales bacterium]|nr:family 16 glycosylhydrolase [Anaerolineales bacterium]
MKARSTPNASVQPTQTGWRLGIQKGDSLSYRDAQLDDYSGLPRHKFPHRTLSLSLRAKVSSSSVAGTWGFGLWNDPFGMSLGFGGSPFRLPMLPNAVWFFYGSEENYLSFKERQPQGFAPTLPANGFMAQTFRSPKFHPLLILAGLMLPFSGKLTRKLLSKVIQEDSISLWSPTACCRDTQEHPKGGRAPALQSQSQGVDVTQWHGYRLEWSAKRVVWYVDEIPVFESRVSPNASRPLGVIIWIDNQYAAFTPEGKIAFGVLEGGDEWLEIEGLEIKEENP